jgi:hypothetical protein
MSKPSALAVALRLAPSTKMAILEERPVIEVPVRLSRMPGPVRYFREFFFAFVAIRSTSSARQRRIARSVISA